jgi:tetratricopeptide (TPR) repeat protein
MNMTDQILNVVEAHCSPKLVSRLMNDLRRTEVLEKKMVSLHQRSPQRDVTFDDRDMLERLITLCGLRLSATDVCQVLMEIGDVFKAYGETSRAEEIYSQAVAKGEESGPQSLLAEAYMRRGEIYSRKGQWQQSFADLVRSKSIFTELKSNALLGRVENILGTNYAEQGKLKRAASFFESALIRLEKSREIPLAGSVLMNLGVVHNIIGRYENALSCFKRAQACFEDIGDMNRLAEVHHNTGMSYLSMQLYSAAIREFDVGYLLSSKTQNVSLMGLASLGKANAYFHRHDMPMALKLVSQSIGSFAKSSDRLSVADVYKVKGMIHREMKRYESAESYFQTSIRINTEMNNQLNLAETLFEMGLLELKRKNKKEALALLQKSRTGFKKVGAREDRKKVEDLITSMKGVK